MTIPEIDLSHILPLLIMITISLLFLLISKLIFNYRKNKFLKFLYRYAFATKRPLSNIFFRNEDWSQRSFHSHWGHEDMRDVIKMKRKEGLIPEGLLMEGFRRILPNQPQLNYFQQDKLTKIFKSIYDTNVAKTDDDYYDTYCDFMLLPSIKIEFILEERELLSEYFREVPDEDEIRKILESLNRESVIDGVDVFWFVEDKYKIHDNFDWDKILINGINLVKKVI